jgi:E3 ubiquitin-protein ligase UBR7
MSEQIELFPKRAFTCDCPTRVGNTDCTLHKGTVAGNASNTYGQNFEAKFCRCHSAYNPKRERETMVQCVVCEDWYHESCLNLRTRPKERPSTADDPVNESDDVADNDSNASNDLPPPLLPSSTYDSLICGSCVLGNDTLRRWAGTRGVMMIVRNESNEEFTTLMEDGGVDPRWKVLTHEDDGTEIVVTSEKEEQKREREDDGHEVCGIEERAAKKPRTEIASSAMSSVPDFGSGTPCTTPPINFVAQKFLNGRLGQTSPGSAAKDKSISLLGEGDIFLTEGWRERWCRCPKVRTYGLPVLPVLRCMIHQVSPISPKASLSSRRGRDVRAT